MRRKTAPLKKIAIKESIGENYEEKEREEKELPKRARRIMRRKTAPCKENSVSGKFW